MYNKEKRTGCQMKGRLYLKCIAIAIGLSCFAQVADAQFVGNPLIPKEGQVIIYTNDAKGGHHQVGTIAERDNISLARRQPGMLCTVMDDGTGKPKTYQLISTNADAELSKNTNWVLFNSGSSNQLIYGLIAPDGATGKTGDFYINTANGNLFGPKMEDNSWPVLLLQGAVSGVAGGDLTGTYPNPAIADSAVTTTKIKPGAADQVMVTNAEGVVAWVDKSTLGTGGAVGAFNGNRPITGLPTVGLNPGTNDLAKWIETVFYPSLGPTASLTANPSGVKEMGPAGSTNVTLNWTAGRAAETAAITEIVVNGQNVFTSSPAPGATVNGTINTTAVNNQANNYSMTVKTADNKTQSASASISFQWKRYYGFLSLGDDGSGTMPTNAQIVALQNEFGTSAAVSNKSVSPSGSQKLVIAYPASWGGSKITVGVNDSTGAFDKTSMSFTNASGGVTTYTVFVQKDNTAGALTFSVQ